VHWFNTARLLFTPDYVTPPEFQNSYYRQINA
jgi:hypothetical protein